MNLPEIRQSIHNKLLRLRALDRLVMSSTFAVALTMAKDDPPLDNPDALELWIDRTLKKDLDDLSIGSLRMKASKLKITFYTSYNKPDLILKIIEAQNARKAQEVSNGVPSENGGHNAPNTDGVGCSLPVPTSV